MEIPKSLNNWLSHRISLAVAAIARYSASADEREMVDYFFAFHETNESLRKIQKPIVDLRESGHAPQSTLEKAFSCRIEEDEKRRP